MIDWQTASRIAGVASNAVTSIDKVYRGYADFFKKRIPQTDAPPPDFTIQNIPAENALVAKLHSNDAALQSITYEDLRHKLNSEDQEHIQTLSRAMQNYEQQWNSAYEARSMTAGMGEFGDRWAVITSHNSDSYKCHSLSGRVLTRFVVIHPSPEMVTYKCLMLYANDRPLTIHFIVVVARQVPFHTCAIRNVKRRISFCWI
jgi:hypothetical protein